MLSSFCRLWLFATLSAVAYQASLSMGILQARMLEWLARPSSRGSSWPEDQIHISFVSCIGRWVSSLPLAPPGKLLCYTVDPYELSLLYNSMSIPVFQFIPPLLTLWLSGKESAVQETLEMWVWSLGREDPLEEETATHSSILAWKHPMDRRAWWAAAQRVAKSWTRLVTEGACSSWGRHCSWMAQCPSLCLLCFLSFLQSLEGWTLSIPTFIAGSVGKLAQFFLATGCWRNSARHVPN